MKFTICIIRQIFCQAVLLLRCAKFSLFIHLIFTTFPLAHAEQCTYETWDWDTVQKQFVNRRKVFKQKVELTKEELGETDECSVCEEDQVEVRIESLPAFKICKQLAEKVTRAIRRAKSNGFPITSIVGYRVGKTKGPLNPLGQRTEFSNHSFGTAIDFNIEKNGLYDFCLQFGPGCRLLRGGPYRRDVAGSITHETAIYKALTDEGFKWGGEMTGKQKDFMHFSLTGM